MNKQHQKWLEEFLSNLKHTNKSERTIVSYRADLMKFITWYEATFKGLINEANGQTITLYKEALSGENSLTTIHPEEMSADSNVSASWWNRAWQKTKNLFSKKKSPSGPLYKITAAPLRFSPLAVNSKRRHLSSIKNFFTYLKEAHEDHSDLFVANPVKSKLHAIKLKDEDVESTKLLTRKDWAHLERKIYRPKERLLINILFWGGLRLSEATHLRVDQFNRENKTITFVRKGGSVHTLHPQNATYLFELLDLHLRFRPHDSDFVFCNKKGEHLSTRAMYNLIVKILTKAQCPTPGLTPHSFRKACATNLYLTTKDLLLVRDYLNHSDAKVTQTYIEMPSSNS